MSFTTDFAYYKDRIDQIYYSNYRKDDYYTLLNKLSFSLTDFYDGCSKSALENINSPLSIDFLYTYSTLIRDYILVPIPLHIDTLKKVDTESEDSNEKFLDDLVYEVRKYLCKSSKYDVLDENKFKTYGCCVFASIYASSLLEKEKQISCKVLNTRKVFGIPSNFHTFLFLSMNDKDYILDCTYSQFLSAYTTTLDAIKKPQIINATPGYFLTTSEKRKNLLDQILKKGYFLATEENIKMYMDSFVLASRNAYYYLNHDKEDMLSTSICGKDYLEQIHAFSTWTDSLNLSTVSYVSKEYAKNRKNPALSYGKNEYLISGGEQILNKQELERISDLVRKNQAKIKMKIK